MAVVSFSSSSCHLCEDVVMDILSRLPVKSLVRFRCVSKSWYDLIKNNNHVLIEQHLQRNLISENNAWLLFVASYASRKLLWISSSRNNSNNEAASLLIEEKDILPSINPDSMPFYHGRDKQYPFILGPVRGIYCAASLRAYTAEAGKGIIVSLCNPALREVKNTPELPHPPTTEDDSRRLIIGSVHYGFGYDSRSNDFKVVAIRWTFWSSEPKNLKCVFLYTLSSNSWKQLDRKNLPPLPSEQPSLFLSHGNGVVYWLDISMKVIIAFDLGTEVFTKLAMPDEIIKGRPRDDAYLAVFNNTLAAIRKPETRRNSEDQKEHSYEVWVMKKEQYDDAVTNNKVMYWTKLYNVGPFLFKLGRPFRFWNNGEIIFEKRERGEGLPYYYLVSYNPITQQFKDLHICRTLELVTYTESLVSIV